MGRRQPLGDWYRQNLFERYQLQFGRSWKFACERPAEYRSGVHWSVSAAELRLTHHNRNKHSAATRLCLFFWHDGTSLETMVELVGIEPTTSSLRILKPLLEEVKPNGHK